MSETPGFRQEQRGVAMAMAGALATAILVLGSVMLADRTTAQVPFAERLQSAIRIDVFVLVWLAAAIANVARLRFFSERDIAGSSAETGSGAVREAGAILQNSLEQAVLAIVTHLIVAATFNQSTTLIAALAGLFGVGRLLFWTGYKRGATGRAFGFALTFYPSVLALAASAITILLGWAR